MNSMYHIHGYKPGHSTETLLLSVYNDIMLNIDNLIITILVLLDLSIVFDMLTQIH